MERKQQVPGYEEHGTDQGRPEVTEIAISQKTTHERAGIDECQVPRIKADRLSLCPAKAFYAIPEVKREE